MLGPARNRKLGMFICAALLAGAIGCSSDSMPSEPSTGQLEPMLVATSSARLAVCTRQSARTASKTIDKWGGSLTLNGHQLVIPAGALAQPVTITMTAPVDTIRTVQLLPEGLTFNPLAQPTLYMNYAGCKQAVTGIAYVNNNLGLLAFLQSAVDGTKGWASARLVHFSRYAVHY